MTLSIMHRAVHDGEPFGLRDGESVVWYDYDYETRMWHLGIRTLQEEPAGG